MKAEYAKPWQLESDPEKAIELALKEIADVVSITDDFDLDVRIFKFRFKPSYNPSRRYVSDFSVE